MARASEALAAATAGWGVFLSEEQNRKIGDYLDLLIKHNLKVNLTAETDPQALLLRHIADGLAAVPFLKESLQTPSPRILDLGSGGGFIGVAIKIAWPEARVTLMEALKRKYDFLNLAAACLALKGLRVLRRSAGKDPLSSQEKDFDAVIARALAPLPEAAALGLPLAAEGGIFVAYQSSPPDPEEPALKKALARLGARLRKSVSYRLPLEDRDRCLAVFERLQFESKRLNY